MNVEENVGSESYRARNIVKRIEHQTAKIPSDVFLWSAVGAMGASLLIQLGQPQRRTWFNMPSRAGQLSLFVGQWAPTLLIFGLYNKMVKMAGSSERSEAEISH